MGAKNSKEPPSPSPTAIKITLKTIVGKEVVFWCEPDNTVEKMKEIANWHGAQLPESVSPRGIVFKGQKLDDKKTLAEQGITSEVTLFSV